MDTGRNWLRQRGTEEDDKVGFIELFYDLIFVFSIVQLSHTMAHHYSVLGMAEAAVMILAVWWVWIYTAWATNWLNPDCMPVRLMLFVLMFLGLVLSTSIPEAFAGRGALFAGAYVAMQFGRTLFLIVAMRGETGARPATFKRMACWFALSAVLWIAGAFAHHEERLVLWAGGIAIDFLAPAWGYWVPGLGRSSERDWDVSGAHMAERCALFIIICLGETILVMGRTFSEGVPGVGAFAAFGLAFLTAAAMWWIYFRFGHHRAAKLIEETDNPGGVARWAYTYAHIPIVAGIILSAVGLEFLLAHPSDPASPGTAGALIGGPLVYLAGNLIFKGLISRRPPLSHLVGLALLAGLAGLAVMATPLTIMQLAAAVVAVLVFVAVWEWASLAEA